MSCSNRCLTWTGETNWLSLECPKNHKKEVIEILSLPKFSGTFSRTKQSKQAKMKVNEIKTKIERAKNKNKIKLDLVADFHTMHNVET